MDPDDSYFFFKMPGETRIPVKKEYGDPFFGLLYQIPGARLKRIESSSPKSSHRGGLIWLKRDANIELPKSVCRPYNMAVFAHRVAHCVLDHGNQDGSELNRRQEAEAWKWAFDWLTDHDIEITRAVERDYMEAINNLIASEKAGAIVDIVGDTVWVRKKWNSRKKARVKITALENIHWSQTECKESGGVPQPFLCADIPPDAPLEGELSEDPSSRHSSSKRTAVYIVRKDNDPGIYSYLKGKTHKNL